MSGRALDYVGFAKLRPGRIHLFCPGCKRKMSNIPRLDHDPKRAVLAHVYCERCSQGCKDDFGGYFDALGREVNWETGGSK